MGDIGSAYGSGARRPELDWVRVGAFGLLILYHVGMAFVTWDWHVKTAHPSHALEPAMMLVNPWRLALLFFVSGCATRFMLTRLTPATLAWRRLGRLGIPLLVGMLVIVPPQSWVQVREHGLRIGYWAFYAKYLSAYQGYCDSHGCLILPTWNHLWFVAYLLIYTLLLAAVLAVLPGLLRVRAPAIPDAFRCAALLSGPAVFLFLTRQVLAHRFPLNQTLVSDWYAHSVYLPMFLLGFAVSVWTPFWDAAMRMRYVALGLALAAYAGMIGIDFIIYPGDDVPPDFVYVLYRGCYAIDQWMWIVAVLGYARRYLRRGGPVLAYLTEGVFPFYILHQTIIVVTEFWLKRLGPAQPVEWAILVCATVAGCWLGFELIRRSAWLRPLFGLRRLPMPRLPPAIRSVPGATPAGR
jgi:glucan biosynthesis protein C